MDTPDFEHGRVFFKQFGAVRVKVTNGTYAARYLVLTLQPSKLTFPGKEFI